MPNIHPILVHLPIALITVSFLFDAAAFLLKRDEFERLGWWTFLCGAIGIAGAVLSGLMAEKTVVIGTLAAEHFQTHQQLAFLVSGICSVLLLWRLAGKTNPPKNRELLFLGVMFLGVVGIWVAGWYGGQLVYRFGVGVQAH